MPTLVKDTAHNPVGTGAPVVAGGRAGNPHISAPTRAEVRARLVGLLREAGVQWAWQGAAEAPDRWLTEAGPADLDLWWQPGTGRHGITVSALVDRLCAELPAAAIADSRDPGRLAHTSLVVRADSGHAVIDLTHGDLRVGPLVLMPAAQVTSSASSSTGDPRLTGASGAADLLIRPLLRGRVPPAARVHQARAAWAGARPAARAGAIVLWREGLGSELADQVVGTLEGGPLAPSMVTTARRRLFRATVTPRSWRSTWRHRHTIAPAGRGASPLGLRGRGVVVALVGTDGSGKSTVAAQVRERLEDSGFSTSSAYFGMARGNLPGVALARRALGVGGVQPAGPGVTSGPAPGHPGQEVADLDRPLLRRAASWFYAAEYVWRYQRTVAPERRRGSIVLVDRYVYDLRESPWPGALASRVAERLVPRPDLLVLPDAPDDVIHARKPERGAREQAAIQARYRNLLAERPARFGHVVVDTSGSTADPVAGLELAAISAAHLRVRESHCAVGATHQAAGPR